MSGQDAEIEWLKASVSCAALLERLPPVWRLDRAESTRRSLKYRRGEGEIVIVNHDGRGWWDPLSDGQGRHLHPRPAPRPRPEFRRRRAACCAASWGSRPRFRRPSARGGHGHRPSLSPSGGRGAGPCRADRRPGATSPNSGDCRSASWWPRARPTPSGKARAAAPGSRTGTARDVLTGIEMRGPDYRNFSAGGDKTLFRLPGGPGRLTRVAVCEAAIDALSLAAIERSRRDTLYAATAGGMGPATIAALQQLLQGLSADPAGMLIAATDADTAGRRYAARLAALATEAAVRFDAILPPDGLNDWNDALRALAPAP